MNYRERMRKAIGCPQFGYGAYGEWGALNLNQRRYIKRLLDEMDRADELIKDLFVKYEKAKAYIKYLEDNNPKYYKGEKFYGDFE